MVFARRTVAVLPDDFFRPGVHGVGASKRVLQLRGRDTTTPPPEGSLRLFRRFVAPVTVASPHRAEYRGLLEGLWWTHCDVPLRAARDSAVQRGRAPGTARPLPLAVSGLCGRPRRLVANLHGVDSGGGTARTRGAASLILAGAAVRAPWPARGLRRGEGAGGRQPERDGPARVFHRRPIARRPVGRGCRATAVTIFPIGATRYVETDICRSTALNNMA